MPSKRPASDAEVEAIRRTVLDYIESCYSWEGRRMKRALHPSLAKMTVWTDPKTGRSKVYHYSASKLVRDVQSGWGERKVGAKRAPMTERQKDIIFIDRYKDMAMVRTEAGWGIDYIGLGKFNGKWKIITVLWRHNDDEAGRTDGPWMKDVS